MAWETEMVVIVRQLIYDIMGSTYAADELQQAIAINAQLIRTEIDFAQTYNIDVVDVTISPDPTAATRDEAFVNLVCLKTACNILSNEARLAAREAVVVSDGPSKVDLVEKYKAAQKEADIACKNYEQAKVEYMTGSGSPGKAVVGPIVSSQIDTIRGNI